MSAPLFDCPFIRRSGFPKSASAPLFQQSQPLEIDLRHAGCRELTMPLEICQVSHKVAPVMEDKDHEGKHTGLHLE